MDLNLLNEISTRTGGEEITYNTFIEDVLSSVKRSIDEGAIVSFQDALNNLVSSSEQG